ncbi:MAG: histidinol-phosphatase [Chloroflexi bacterium RBG_16_68_14]|nr:MAG: histidinol-phosphatase [Chloroflexi bacterium RBG_16_68_14]
MAAESLRDLLEVAVDLAEEAGKITLQYFGNYPAVETKADMTPVTVADREVEAYLRAAIASRFPGDGIIGEEFGEERAGAARRWIIDPIDGTFSFIHGVPLYGLLIGVEQDDEPLLGVIRLPALDETVAAACGEGCRWQGRKTTVSTVSELSAALCLATDLGGQDPTQSSALRRLAAATGATRTWGDCYGYVLVATGRADVMVDPVMHVWDCAALLPVIEEAGGVFTDWQGRRTIRRGNAVASNGLLHDQVLALLSNSRETRER